MSNFVQVTDDGRFALDGSRWFCNSVIYFGHYPGAMANWFTDDVWRLNQPRLAQDFARMQALGINHAALFLSSEMFFDAGQPVEQGYRRLDEVLKVASANDVRLTFFTGPFIDNENEYRRITGKEWAYGNHWLPSFNEALFEAYVAQAAPMAERYRDEPMVLGYGDRIDRFHKGFDNISIPFNLKDEWASFLLARYGTFAKLREAVGGTFENGATDFNEVMLPQESRLNASLGNPLAFDYVLWQKKTIGDSQAQWDARMAEIAPRQVFWTPFEGCTLDWAMLDGFTPETKRLHAVWMEYYHWQAVRSQPVGPYDEWAHTREFITGRLHDQSPTIYNMAYILTRYVKQSVQRPVVICHGVRLDAAITGAVTETNQVAIIDRVNAACLAADGDGWHYWCWTDDWESSLAHKAEQVANPTDMYWQGESMGLYTYEDHPRPVTAIVHEYSSQLKRIVARNEPVKRSEVLLLSSSARMYNLFRRMAMPTVAAINGALTRLGVEADYLWTSQNDVKISQETLNSYKLIVIGDNAYERDFAEIPEMLLEYVKGGGVLYFALDRHDRFHDEHGVETDHAAIAALSGADPNGQRNWPGADERFRNWPFPTSTPHEPNFDALAFPRLSWGICPEYRHRAATPGRQQFLGQRASDDGDAFTIVPALVDGADVIAVGKFESGTKPFIYKHRIGKGTVVVNAWTNNIFRDSEIRRDYGGWEYDFILSLAMDEANLIDVDINRGASIWLRNVWGYHWREM